MTLHTRGATIIVWLLMGISCRNDMQHDGIASYRSESKYEATLARFTNLVQREQLTETDKTHIHDTVIDLVKTAFERLRDHGIESHVINDGTTLEIVPGNSQELSRLSAEVVKSNARLQYDVKFFVRQPYAAASFRRDTHVLLLSHGAIIKLGIDDTTRHELVHLRVWSQLGQHIPSPYYGFLIGKEFQPDDLYLDEMKAYDSDLVAASGDLQQYLNETSEEALASSDLLKIWKTRESQQRPAGPLTTLEAAYDRVLSKSIFGGFHSSPAISVLESLAVAIEDPALVRFVVTPEGVTAFVSVYRTSSRQTEDRGVFYLATSRGIDDPQNASLLRHQIRWVHQTAGQHAKRFADVCKIAYDVAQRHSPSERLQLLRDLAAMSIQELSILEP